MKGKGGERERGRLARVQESGSEDDGGGDEEGRGGGGRKGDQYVSEEGDGSGHCVAEDADHVVGVLEDRRYGEPRRSVRTNEDPSGGREGKGGKKGKGGKRGIRQRERGGRGNQNVGEVEGYPPPVQVAVLEGEGERAF